MQRSRIELAPAYVLHQTPWRDTSRIYEVLTRDHGRLSLFARGVRAPKSRFAGLMQPFAPVLLSFSLRGEAGTLAGVEPVDSGGLPALAPRDVLSAYYLSELVMKLTIRNDPQADIYDHYHQALLGLRAGGGASRPLRLFEKRLLESLGYGLDLRVGGVADGDGVSLGYHYQASPATLRSLADERLETETELEEARLLLKKALTACLEGRPLKTRRVAEQMRELRRTE
ncbi:MAG: DNA repair protein RecO [Steroidobacteraceae bacterium]